MDPETPTTPRRPRLRRALAVAAGVAMVPALYAVATACSVFQRTGREPRNATAWRLKKVVDYSPPWSAVRPL